METGIGAVELECAVQLALAAQHARGQLVGEAAIAFGQSLEVTITRVGEWCAGANFAENLEGRATRRHRDFAALHAARQKSGATRDRRQAHRVRHRHRILRGRDRRVHQNSVHALLHGHARIGRGAHAGIDDHRHVQPPLDRADAERIEQAEPAADR